MLLEVADDWPHPAFQLKYSIWVYSVITIFVVFIAIPPSEFFRLFLLHSYFLSKPPKGVCYVVFKLKKKPATLS